MYFKRPESEEHYISDCPLCNATGYIMEDKVSLRSKLFVKDIKEVECVLCNTEGSIEIVDKSGQTKRDTSEGDFYSRGGTFF